MYTKFKPDWSTFRGHSKSGCFPYMWTMAKFHFDKCTYCVRMLYDMLLFYSRVSVLSSHYSPICIVPSQGRAWCAWQAVKGCPHSSHCRMLKLLIENQTAATPTNDRPHTTWAIFFPYYSTEPPSYLAGAYGGSRWFTDYLRFSTLRNGEAKISESDHRSTK